MLFHCNSNCDIHAYVFTYICSDFILFSDSSFAVVVIQKEIKRLWSILSSVYHSFLGGA